MPRVSKQSASIVDDFGVAEDRHEDLAGHTVDFVTIRQTHDLAAMLAPLPGGRCPCPHFGYVLKGRVTVRYEDHEEVLTEGDAFVMTPGHVPEAEEGTELVQFSPADELAAMMAVVRAGQPS